MEPEEKELPIIIINWPAARKFIIYPFLALLGCVLVYHWVNYAWPAFKQGRARIKAIKPLRAEARVLALSYEKALENPAAAIGKPVIWCMQNRGEYSVTVGGEERKRLKVLDYPAMPLFLGSKHSACAGMLMTVTEVSKTGAQPLITVRFIELLE